MTVAFHITVLASVLALFIYIWTAVLVGRARSRFGVHAPATDGPEEFRRYFRVQQNTLEQLVLFLPALWLAFASYGAAWPAFVGFVWSGARIIYAMSYVADPQKRGFGFILTFLSSFVLLLAVLVRSVMALI